MFDYDSHFNLTEKQIVSPDNMVPRLAAIAKLLLPRAKVSLSAEMQTWLASVDSQQEDQVMVTCLLESMQNTNDENHKICLLLGNTAFHHPQAALIRVLSQLIATMTGAKLGFLTEGGNAGGAWLAGAVPHRGPGNAALSQAGLAAEAMLAMPRKGYLLLNVEPDVDCANPIAATEAMQQAECVVALSLFKNTVLEQHAHVILPIVPFTETSGTFINAAGDWQRFGGVATPVATARPAWKVLRVLGNLLGLSGFEYQSSDQIFDEVKSRVDSISLAEQWQYRLPEKCNSMLDSANPKALYRLGIIPLYAGDSVVRRATALQTAQTILHGSLAVIRLHPAMAAQLELSEGMVVTVKQNQGQVRLPVMFDARLPLRTALIVGGIPETARLTELFGVVEIQSMESP